MRHHKYIYAFAYQEHEDIQNTVWLIRIKKLLYPVSGDFSRDNATLIHLSEMMNSENNPKFDPFMKNSGIYQL